jgi:hypothetical protein
MIGRKFDRAERTEVLSGDDTDRLALQAWPLASVASVSIDGLVLDSDEYAVDHDTGILWRVSDLDYGWDGTTTGRRVMWPRGHQNISVTYTGGYLEADMPADLQAAMCEVVDSMLARRGTDGELVSSAMGAVNSTRLAPADRHKYLRTLFVAYYRDGA